MGATEWAAWVGACTGVAGVGWNIYLKLSSGPKLHVRAISGMVLVPSAPGNPEYLPVIVTNKGTAATTITNVGLCTYDSRWKSFRRRSSQQFVIVNYQGTQLPVKLETGEQWRILMSQDEKFRELLSSGELWVSIFHSFSMKSSDAIIIRPRADGSPKDK